MNLFEKMRLEPLLTHGPEENGKDIVCKEENSFGTTEWVAVVVKVGDIKGKTSDPGSLQTVMNQVQEALSHPYDHPIEKRAIYMSKVLMVTNAEITATAREKLLEKLERVSVQLSCIHFLDGRALVGLLNKHWPQFWTERPDALAETDPMTEEVGFVLYALARAFTLSHDKKKKVPSTLGPSDIQKQTQLERNVVDDALKYLLKTQYLEQREGGYSLHPKVTRGRLLTDLRHIDILLAIEAHVNGSLHFTQNGIIKIATKAPMEFTQKFIIETLAVLREGDYVRVDTSRGKGHFILNANMLNDEREYLKCWRQYKTALPQKARS